MGEWIKKFMKYPGNEKLYGKKNNILIHKLTQNDLKHISK